MKSFIACLLALTLLLGLAGCHKEEPAPTTVPTTAPTEPAPVEKEIVDIFLPEESFEKYGEALTEALNAKGHESRLHYAKNDPKTQAKQIQDQVQKGTQCVVVVPVDAMTLSEELQLAQQENIPVVTLDRQLLYADYVNCAVTFDYVSVGVMLGSRIAEAKSLTTAKEENRSYTIEFLMGAPEDQNAVLIHRGVISVLQPYLDSGVLTAKTGRVTMEDTFVTGWETLQAKEKCLQYLETYQEAPVDILCAASDAIAEGCVQALAEAGYTEENWPMITGVGGDQAGLERIAAGQQSMTVYKDMDTAFEICARMIHSLLTGQALPAADNAVISFGEQSAPLYISPVAPVLGPEDLVQYGFDREQLGLPEDTTPPETTAPDGDYSIDLA